MIGFGQPTVNIPDANFKAYLLGNNAINTNGDAEIQVSEAAVFLGSINCYNLNISDLTGIEAFSALTYLNCKYNQLTSIDISNNLALISLECVNNQITSLDLSNNLALTNLDCSSNQLTSLNVSNNTNLITLRCNNNQLTNLDVSQNTILGYFDCSINQLTSLDVSNNLALTNLGCQNNQLTSLNVSNNTALNEILCDYNQLISLDISNNLALYHFQCENNQLTSLNVSIGSSSLIDGSFLADNNPNLFCINVDNVAWATANWTVANGSIDPQHFFSTNCPPPSAIQEHTTNKELLKVTDLLGRETKGKKNEPLFYIYDDGTVEKRIVIE